jgi:hypothetical protein
VAAFDFFLPAGTAVQAGDSFVYFSDQAEK